MRGADNCSSSNTNFLDESHTNNILFSEFRNILAATAKTTSEFSSAHEQNDN